MRAEGGWSDGKTTALEGTHDHLHDLADAPPHEDEGNACAGSAGQDLQDVSGIDDCHDAVPDGRQLFPGNRTDYLRDSRSGSSSRLSLLSLKMGAGAGLEPTAPPD